MDCIENSRPTSKRRGKHGRSILVCSACVSSFHIAVRKFISALLRAFSPAINLGNFHFWLDVNHGRWPQILSSLVPARPSNRTAIFDARRRRRAASAGESAFSNFRNRSVNIFQEAHTATIETTPRIWLVHIFCQMLRMYVVIVMYRLDDFANEVVRCCDPVGTQVNYTHDHQVIVYLFSIHLL